MAQQEDEGIFHYDSRIPTFEVSEQVESVDSLNLPRLRIWDLDDSSTRYDKLLAAPSDSDMYLMWVIWSVIMAIVAAVSGYLFVAILRSRKARENPFNSYLLSLVFSDMMMSLLCFVTCWINASAGHVASLGWCYFHSFFFIFGICASSYLNALIASKLYHMLQAARSFREIVPPTHRRVFMEASAVYLWAGFVASWGLIDAPWWPHKTELVLGISCIPIDYDTKSSIFFYCVFFPVVMGGPLAYILYVLFRIYKYNLMPRTGKRRLLAIYFFRLAIVFVIMWIPAILLKFVLGPWVNHWVVWAGGSWSHLQGLVSSLLSLLKPDVAEAARDLWPFPICLKRANGSDDDDPDIEDEESVRDALEQESSFASPNQARSRCSEGCMRFIPCRKRYPDTPVECHDINTVGTSPSSPEKLTAFELEFNEKMASHILGKGKKYPRSQRQSRETEHSGASFTSLHMQSIKEESDGEDEGFDSYT